MKTELLKQILLKIVKELSSEEYIRVSHETYDKFKGTISGEEMFKKIKRATRENCRKWDEIEKLINKL